MGKNYRHRIERMESSLRDRSEDSWPPPYTKGGLDFSSREDARDDYLKYLNGVMAHPNSSEKVRNWCEEMIDYIMGRMVSPSPLDENC